MFQRILIVLLFCISVIFDYSNIFASSNSLEDYLRIKDSIEYKIRNNIFDEYLNTRLEELTYYFLSHNPEEGIIFYNKLLSNSNVQKNEYFKAVSYINLSRLYLPFNKYDVSLKYLLNANNFFLKSNKSGSYHWTLCDIGNIYFKIKEFRKAIGYYEKARAGFKKLIEKDTIQLDGDIFGYAVTTENIGLCYAELFEYDKALEKLNEGLIYRKKVGYYSGIKLNHLNTGEIFLNMGNYDSAHKRLMYSFELSTNEHTNPAANTENQRFHAKALLNFYRLFSIQNNRDSSQHYHKLLEFYIDSVLSSNYKVSVLVEVVTVKTNLGEFESALMDAEKAFIIARENHLNISLSLLENQYIKILRSLGRYKDALEYSDLFKHNNDSLFFATTSKTLNLVLSEDKLQQINEKAAIRENENKLQIEKSKDLMIILILIILFVSSFIVFLMYQNNLRRKLNINLQQSNKKLEESKIELSQLNENLTNTNLQLEEIDTTRKMLFSIIAHDLKNSIGGNLSLSKLLSDEYEDFDDAEKREYVDLIYSSSEKLQKLLDNLLVWSMTIKGTIKPRFDINYPFMVCNNSIGLYSQSMEEKMISVENNIPQDLSFNFDASMIDLVFRNLINNAVKYSNMNGVIAVNYERNENYHKFSVVDNGVGMLPDKAKDIFKANRNKSTEGTKGEKGTGLGLMICYEFIKIHNGDIWFESEINKGTQVYFTIPSNL